MFIQDVSAGLMPYRSSENDKYDAKISGPPQAVEQALIILASLERYDRRDEKEVVADAVREIALSLSWYGLAPYEIAQNEDGAFQLSGFTAKRLFRLPFFILQWVPKADRNIWPRRFVVLPRRIVWLIEMPKELGGYRGYKRILKRLSRFRWTAPAFWSEDLQRGQIRERSFDFSEYRRALDIYHTRATRVWGWNGRDTSSRNRNEFGLFYRIITFQWAHAVLREHIVRELNSLFVRLGIEAEIQMSGLKTPEEILKIRDAMVAGSISYSKAYDEVKA
jgi:hypothetical protein